MKNNNILNFIKHTLKPNDKLNFKVENIINNNKHYPVMVNKVISTLKLKYQLDDKIDILDATFGTGGHSFEILNTFKNANITGLDLDKTMIEINNNENNNLELVNMNFKDSLKLNKKFDFILCDLGYSIKQLNSNRGLSYMNDTILDMRYDTNDNNRKCEDIINTIPLLNLYEGFNNFSSIKDSKSLAQSFVKYRKNKKITSKEDIIKILNMLPNINTKNNNKLLKLVYQSLRIMTNDEYNNLESFLNNLIKIKSNKGIILFISFHDMEHKLIKKYIKDNKKYLRSIKLDIKPDKKEVIDNLPSKSARLYKFEFKDNLKIQRDNMKF